MKKGSVAEVDAGREGGVGGEAFGWDVGRGNT